MIYAPWPTKKTTMAHYWAMAHRLKTVVLDKARLLDAAQKNSEEFSIAQAGFKPDENAAVIHRPPVETIDQENLASSEKNLNSELNATSIVEKCYFCGKKRHSP